MPTTSPPLVAAYKGISVAEAQKLDAAEVINELVNDEGVRSFFQACLAEKSRARNLTLLHKYYDWQLIESLPLAALGGLLSFATEEEKRLEKAEQEKRLFPHGLQIMPLQSCKARRLWTTKRL